MAERNGADNTSGLTEGDGLLRDVLQGVAVAGLAQHAVLDLLAGGHGGTRSGGVGDQVVLHVVVVGPSLGRVVGCLLYTSPSPRDLSTSRMPSSA